MSRVIPIRPHSPKAGPRSPWTHVDSYGGSQRGKLSDTAFVRIVIWAMMLTFLIGWHGYGWVARQDAAAPVAPTTLQGDVRDPWAQSRKQREILTAQEGPPSAAFEPPSVIQPGTASASSDVISIRFGYCVGASRVNCVIDGDTFWLGGEKIRIADIDTPEISSPGCASEKALGQQAKSRLRALLNTGPFSLQSVDRNTDRYGRKLRLIIRNGESLGAVLVNEGLARYYSGGRQPWC